MTAPTSATTAASSLRRTLLFGALGLLTLLFLFGFLTIGC